MTIPLMIDSGGFTAYTQGREISLSDYIAFCLKWQEIHPHAVFITLDIVKNPEKSWKQWCTMQKEGVDAVPVYQLIWPEKWIKKYLARSNRLAIAMGTWKIRRSSTRRMLAYDQIWERFLIDEDRMPRYEVHGLAVTSFKLMLRYPWYSVDSTSWMMNSRTGQILLPARSKGQWCYKKPPRQISISTWKGTAERGSRFRPNQPKKKAMGGSAKSYVNLQPKVQGLVLQYLKEQDVRLGFSCKLEGGGQVLFRGVSTFHGDRDRVCMEVYASFLQQLPYPRPFLKRQRSTSFGIV